MNCPHCGKEVDEEGTFCKFCGQSLADNNDPEKDAHEEGLVVGDDDNNSEKDTHDQSLISKDDEEGSKQGQTIKQRKKSLGNAAKAGIVAVIAVAAFALGRVSVTTTSVTTGTSSDTSSSTMTATSDEDSSTADETEQVEIKTSTDKHLAYVKNYVGMNCANLGYVAMDGRLYDDYGNGKHVLLILVTPDGTYLNHEDDSDDLRGYKVSAQNVKPNTEINCTYKLDPDGEEYSNLVSFQSVEEVVLAVDKVGENGNTKDMTPITPSPDRYSCYVRDYCDRNLADCGYESLSGDLYDDYGSGCRIKLDIVADDGSYVDPSDIDSLSQYKVVSQSVDPNTQIDLVPRTDSDGVEYDNVLAEQSVESITLNVTHLSS